MIKIVTGYSGPGGSTLAFKNLCNEFNKRDLICEMYGPNEWHTQFGSNFKSIKNLSLSKTDKVISHFIDLNPPFVQNTIFSCHEMWWFDFKKINNNFSKVHFLTQKQADYHNSIKNYFLLPNIKEQIQVTRDSSSTNVAGVIGAIEHRKNTVASIERALKDKCSKVLLFGPVMDDKYFKDFIVPMMGHGVIYMGYEKSKEAIYSKIDRVYHTSNGEVASLVKDECYSTGTLFFGNESTDNEVSKMSNDEIIKVWQEKFYG